MKKILITGGNGNIARLIKRNLTEQFDILNPSRIELNLLDSQQIKNYLHNNSFDILIHTAIKGGRRTKDDTSDVTHSNLLMFENLSIYFQKFKMVINLDSAAIYDRSTDIMSRNENDLFTIPMDYYGFSKYIIYQRSLSFPNIFNFRIFNIFHNQEEPERFIKSCYIAKQNDSKIIIFQDKYFDFFHEFDFIKVLNYYIRHSHNISVLPKTMNLCYNEKYKLSEIANFIIGKDDNIIIENNDCLHNYCGSSATLDSLHLNTNKTLKEALEHY
jgi:nucleoside-diphosphate-sugar epimerase